MQFRKRNLIVFSALLAIAAVFGACLKSVESTPPKPQTYISLLHLAPSAPPIDVFLNDTKSTSTPVPSGAYFARYSALDPKAYTVTFKKGNSDSVVATIPAGIYDSLSYSSLLLYNNPFGNGALAARIEDDFSQFSTSQANIRFWHVAPGLMSVDVYFDNTKLENNRQYVDNLVNGFYNVFQHRTSGFYTISVKKAGSDSLIVSTTTTFAQNQAYTILLSGVPGQVGDHALAVDILQASN